MLNQILVALGCCILVFGSSHFVWCWRKKKHGDAAIPIFWERLPAILILLVVVSKTTGWPADEFALWMVSGYLVCLILYTWYLYRKYHAPKS